MYRAIKSTLVDGTTAAAAAALARTKLHFLECGILSRKYCPSGSLEVFSADTRNTYAAATSFLCITNE